MTLYLTRSGHVRGTSILVFCSNVAAKRFIVTRSGPALSRSSNSSFSHIADKDFEGISIYHVRYLLCLDANDQVTILRPLSTQENKHRIGLYSSCIILSAPPDRKKLKILELFYLSGCGAQVQTGTENWYRKPMSGFNFVPIRSDPMLIFLSGNRSLQCAQLIGTRNILRENVCCL